MTCVYILMRGVFNDACISPNFPKFDRCWKHVEVTKICYIPLWLKSWKRSMFTYINRIVFLLFTVFFLITNSLYVQTVTSNGWVLFTAKHSAHFVVFSYAHALKDKERKILAITIYIKLRLGCLGRLFDVGFPWPYRMSGLCGWPSLPHNFKANKSMKIFICTIFAI